MSGPSLNKRDCLAQVASFMLYAGGLHLWWTAEKKLNIVFISKLINKKRGIWREKQGEKIPLQNIYIRVGGEGSFKMYA